MDYNDAALAVAAVTAVMTFISIGLVWYVVQIVGLWKVFAKAGQPGWAALVPLYNVWVLIQIVGRPQWWFLLLLVPGVNGIVAIILMWDLAAAFGKEFGFFLGLVLLTPIFTTILGFGTAQYRGPVAARSGSSFEPPVPPTA